MTEIRNLDISRTLGRLETHIVSLGQNIMELKNSVNGVRDRVMVLERQQHLWRGGLGVLLTMSAVAEVYLRWSCK